MAEMHGRCALQLGEGREQWVPDCKGVAEGGYDQQPGLGRFANDELEQTQRRHVGPVQVIERQQHGLLGGDASPRLRNRIE